MDEAHDGPEGAGDDEAFLDEELLSTEGLLIASHSVEVDGIGSCEHRVLKWRGGFWLVSTDLDGPTRYDTLGDAITLSEGFVCNEGVDHELDSNGVAHDEFLELLRAAQDPHWLPCTAMPLRINGIPYLLTPEGSFAPSVG